MKFFSIKKKIFLYIFTLTTLSLIITSFLIYFLFIQTLKNNEIQLLIRTSNKVKQELEFFLRLVDSTGASLATNEDLLNELSSEYAPLSEKYKQNKNMLDTMLYNMISVPGYIKGIHIVSPKGHIYTNDVNVKEADLRNFFDLKVEGTIPEKEYYTGVHLIKYTLFPTSNAISYIRPIYNIKTEENLGTIIIDINYEYLKEMFIISSIQSDEKVLVISDNGERIFTFPYNINLDEIIDSNPDLIKKDKSTYNKKVFGKDSFIVSNTIAYSNWKFVRVIPTDKVYNDIRPVKTVSLIVGFIFIILSLSASIILSFTLTKPIKELNENIKMVESGNLDVNIKVKSNDELGQLSNSFNTMITELKKLIKSSLEDQKKKSSMEFEILQAQINPHFLYNTLDSIKWLAVIQQVDNIADMATALINLLKYNISKNDHSVTLGQEIESIINYIKIQKYRYGDSFTVTYNIQKETSELKVLKFILQPIVENAIFHGFENMSDNGLIEITTRINQSKLIIEVQDNGIGIDSTNTVVSVKELDKNRKFNGIGLKNINERIKLYFGEEYGLTIKSMLGSGTNVAITLPVLDK